MGRRRRANNKFMINFDYLFAHTSDDLKLPGFHYPAESDLCVLMVHGMSGFFLENYFGHVLGVELQQAGIGYIYTHNRGYAHICDIETSKIRSDGGFETVRGGAMYERFEGCVPDIEAWLEKGRELGYKKFIVIGHSLGGPKVVHHFYKTSPSDIVGMVLASPGDMVGLVKKVEYQKNYEGLLAEAKQALEDGKPDKILSGKIWDWYLISAQTFLDLFEENGPADDLPVMRNPDRFIELESVNVPILCLMGENDDVAIRTLPEDMELLKQKATNAPSFEKQIIPGANHSYIQKEKEFSAEIIKWIKGKIQS